MKWYGFNLGNRIRFALRHPAYTFRSLARDVIRADERFLASVTGRTVGEIHGFLNEPFRDPAFVSHVKKAQGAFGQLELESADLFAKKVLIQYAVIRACRPGVVVETGVANGVSTTYVLYALHRNGIGQLHSVEIGDSTYLPRGASTGWLVPDWLRSRWKLHLGDSREVLPKLLRELGQIDLFIHDSLHTYEHMMFEFEQAYPGVRPAGLILADDALWNSSLRDFADRVRAPRWDILRGVGILQKGRGNNLSKCE